MMNGNIFVADNDNHRIQIFGGKGSLDSQFTSPCGLSVVIKFSASENTFIAF